MLGKCYILSWIPRLKVMEHIVTVSKQTIVSKSQNRSLYTLSLQDPSSSVAILGQRLHPKTLGWSTGVKGDCALMDL